MGTPYDAWAGEVLGLYAAPMRRKATAAKMRQVLGEFGALCRSPGDVTAAAVAAWIAGHPGRRASTVRSLLGSLRAALRYGVRTGAVASSPLDWRSPADWARWDDGELEPPARSSAEVARVLALADDEAAGGDWRAGRLRAVVYTLAYTGARKDEVLGLAAADVDLPGASIWIRPNEARPLKTRGSAARVPVAAPLAGVLGGWLPACGSRWLFPGIRRRTPWLEGAAGDKALDQVKALGLRAGVPGLTCLAFRHTFASLAEGWGLGELALQRVLRHTSVRTQRGYRHELPEVLRAAAGKIRFGAADDLAARDVAKKQHPGDNG